MRPKFDTPVTRLFGIEYPIVQGAMAWLSESNLVAAVSNAGGLGVLGASLYSLDDFERLVIRTKELTDRPFGVNFALVLADFQEHLEMCLSQGVKVFFVSAGSPKKMTPIINAAGALCVHVVPNLKLALKVEAAGVDAVVLESYEAGGHVSPEGITGLVNIPHVARHLKRPLIAAGGIVCGRGMAAALALGADGIQMGTRFLATKENNAHSVYKDLLMSSQEGDATVYSRWYHPGRALKSPAINQILRMEEEGSTVDQIRAFVGRGRAQKAAHFGLLEEGMFYAGAGAGMVNDIITVEEVFERILSEYQETVDRLPR